MSRESGRNSGRIRVERLPGGGSVGGGVPRHWWLGGGGFVEEKGLQTSFPNGDWWIAAQPKDEPLSLTFLLQAHENHFIFRLPFQ